MNPSSCTAEPAPCLLWGQGCWAAPSTCTDTITLLSHTNQRFFSFFSCSSPQNDERTTNKPFIFLPFLSTSLFQRLSNCCVICGTKIFLVSKMKSKSEMQLFHLVTSSAFVLSCSYCQLSFPEVTLSCEHILEAERQTVMWGQWFLLPVNCLSLSTWVTEQREVRH